jgi:hypothetical protein
LEYAGGAVAVVPAADFSDLAGGADGTAAMISWGRAARETEEEEEERWWKRGEVVEVGAEVN